MTVRFAAAQRRPAPLARWLCVGVHLTPANDNRSGVLHDPILRSALFHFAESGLGAAGRARDVALQAALAGQREEARHWQAVCQALDKRMGKRLATKVEDLIDA